MLFNKARLRFSPFACPAKKRVQSPASPFHGTEIIRSQSPAFPCLPLALKASGVTAVHCIGA